MSVDIRKDRRETIRWILVLACWNSRGFPLPERVLLTTVKGEFPDCTEVEIRQELTFLEVSDMVDIERRNDGKWFASITAAGCAVYENNADCPPGIARPPKYW